MKNKKVLIWTIVGVVAVALIALVIILLVTNSNKEKEKPKENEPKQQETEKKKKKQETNEVAINEGDEISEDEIVAIYGLSKKDAEEMIKKYFTEDGYEFSTKITRAGFYRVSVKDTVNGDVLTFRVDPETKTAIQE